MNQAAARSRRSPHVSLMITTSAELVTLATMLTALVRKRAHARLQPAPVRTLPVRR